MFDILIVGGGPAGSTFARMVSHKYKVLLLDRRHLDKDKDMSNPICCGGLLAPDAQKMLAHLGLGIPEEVICGPQMFSVRSIDFDNHLIRHYQRHYINVYREKFDRWLVSLIGHPVKKVFGASFLSLKDMGDHFVVTYKEAGRKVSVKTKYVVGADGATSIIRRHWFGEDLGPEKYLSIQHEYETRGVMPFYVSLFDRHVTDFYSWIIQKDKRLYIGTGIKEKDYSKDRFNKLVEDSRKLGLQVGKEVKCTGTWIMRTRKLSQILLYKKRVFLIGEAAGLISPSSAEGISYALRSGQHLAKAFNKSLDRKDYTTSSQDKDIRLEGKSQQISRFYQRKCMDLKLNLLGKNFKVMVMYNPFLRKLVMLSGFLSMTIDDQSE